MKEQLLTALLSLSSLCLCAQNPGDLIITEYMANPEEVPDDEGEYIELYNTAQYDLPLQGCVLQDASNLTVVIEDPIWVAPGGIAIIGASATPAADYYYPSSPPPFSLNNLTGDQITLTCNGILIAQTAYSQPQTAGQSMELAATNLHDNGLTTEDNYLPASSQFQYNGVNEDDFGSPTFAGNTMVLPVELSHFEASRNGKSVNLYWETATELNNSHFEVEHSTHGRNFQAVARIEGAGNSQLPQSYHFQHRPYTGGLQYYRLAQYDYDGTRSYSATVTARLPDGEQKLTAFPTLTEGRLHLRWPNPALSGEKLRIHNQMGQLVAEHRPGPGSTAMALSVDQLSQGRYYVSLQSRQKTITGYFIKR